MLSGLFAGVFAGIGAWFAGRLHLRKTQLKALDKNVHLPAGTLEDKANAASMAATALATGLAASQASAALSKSPFLAKVDPIAGGNPNAGA